MDALKLKRHAELLEAEIQANLNKSKDVEFLSQYQPLIDALADAKAGQIMEPRELGDWLSSYWIFESNIQDFRELCHRLAQFENLLRGWELSSDD